MISTRNIIFQVKCEEIALDLEIPVEVEYEVTHYGEEYGCNANTPRPDVEILSVLSSDDDAYAAAVECITREAEERELWGNLL